MSLFAFVGAIEIGLIFALVSIGVLLSFRVLNFPDLTVDGSFPLGAAVCATMIFNGYDPFLSTFIAFLCGFGAGLVTAWLNVKFNILHLLASILTMIALYSINIRVMGRPNIPLLNQETIFTPFYSNAMPELWVKLIVLFVIIIVSKILIDLFLTSQTGLAMRATGSNMRMARAQGVNTGHMIYLGIALSNALVALAGALYAQTYAYADSSLGIGVIIIGLAAVILGESILFPRTIIMATLACVIGSIVYRIAVGFALDADLEIIKSSDLNLITAIIVTFALILPQTRQKLLSSLQKRRKT